MKFVFFIFCLLLVSPFSQSQWTNGSGLVYYNGGLVGIGTATPQSRLHIADSYNAPSIILGVNYYTGGYTGLITELSAVSGGFARLQGIKSAGIEWGDIVLNQFGGNIGIGTATPQAKLAVNGDIFSKKVKVTQTGWPDYVFQATYNLRPLSEVEQYIQLHHHLPEVPSAVEIEKDGVDLGNNQAVLLRKIEELTLYVINLNKEIEALKKEITPKKGSN